MLREYVSHILFISIMLMGLVMLMVIPADAGQFSGSPSIIISMTENSSENLTDTVQILVDGEIVDAQMDRREGHEIDRMVALIKELSSLN